MEALQELEGEAIFIIREVANQFERPGLLFSGGKESIVIVHLAKKAFSPAPIPFPLVHIDTGHNFPEAIAFRNRIFEENGIRMIVGSVQDSIDAGRVIEETGPEASRIGLLAVSLLDTMKAHRIDAVLGGGRKYEEKARAKELFSHRDVFGQWDPKNQHPELWKLFNDKMKPGKHFRAFPIFNWTEREVWEYIAHEDIEIPSLYFSHRRSVFNRRGVWLPDLPFIERYPDEKLEEHKVRFHTIGDATCTSALLSTASTLEEIIAELAIDKTKTDYQTEL